jgi:hypothetical protein
MIRFDLMSEIFTDSNKDILYIMDPHLQEIIGEISLIGDPIPVGDWIGSNGPLQRFEILRGIDALREVWANQEEVLLLTKYGQRNVKIITYPTEGETQGNLDYVSELIPYRNPRPASKPLVQRSLAFLQSLLGT